MVRAAISVDEYLSTAYEWTPDYLEGSLAERPTPSTQHSRVQLTIGAAFSSRERETGLYCYPEIHLPVAPQRYRVADLAIFLGPAESPYPSRPPLAVMEILSPQDSLSQLLERLHDYHAWSVPNIWLIDPEHRTIHRYDGASLLAVDAIEFAPPVFRLSGADLFAAASR